MSEGSSHDDTAGALDLLRAHVRLLPPGIADRQFRAAMPAIGAVTLIQVVTPIVWVGPHMVFSIGAESDPRAWATMWTACSVAVAFMLGVLCGAEEAENGTADFARRLPVTRGRILAAKMGGCLGSYVVWAIISLALVGLTLAALRQAPSIHFFGELVKGAAYTVTWAPLLFSAALAAGLWIERVVPAAAVAGAVSWFYVIVGILLTTDRGLQFAFMSGDWPVWLFWVGCVVAMVVAAVRFFTREGS